MGALQPLDDATAPSVKARDGMQELAAQLQNRDWRDAVKANFNGLTDQALATNVQLLGQSMEITHKVIRVTALSAKVRSMATNCYFSNSAQSLEIASHIT